MSIAGPSLDATLAALWLPGTGKFQVAKSLVALSESDPASLYPSFDRIRALLDSENSIIKWTAFQVIANLAAADVDGRIEKILNAYLAPIRGPVMITAAHAIAGAARIAGAQPRQARRAVRGILRVVDARYQTEECRNIAIGHAIKALETLSERIRRSKAVVAFVRAQTSNTRPATRKKAEAFLKRIASGSRTGKKAAIA